MRICLLGATGASGKAILNYAQTKLQHENNNPHQITAIVRSPEKLENYKNTENIKIIKGDVFSSENLSQIFNNHDVVISALGFRGRNEEFPNSMKAITQAMKNNQIKDIIIVGSQYHSLESQQKESNWLLKFFINYIIKKVLDDHHRMYQFLETLPADENEASPINWHYACFPGLGGIESTEKELRVEKGVDIIMDRGSGRVSRGDVARYVFSQIGQVERGQVSVCYK